MIEQFNSINSYLTFRIEKEIFATHVSSVLHILELTHITKVPQSPEFLLGVINLRGSALPVIDLRKKIGFSSSNFTEDTCIIVMELILENEKIQTGMLVDSVLEVIEIKKEQILELPTIGAKYSPEYIDGVFKKNETFIMILKVDKILSTKELISIKIEEKSEIENNNSDNLD